MLVEVELNNPFYINDILVEPEKGSVSVSNNTQVVEPKVMALLIELCKSPEKVISAEALFALVWPGSIYSPNSVRRNIALLRQVLEDHDKTLIKTHPKRGYSLDAEIKEVEAAVRAQKHEVRLNRSHLNNTSIFIILSFIIVGLFVWFQNNNTPAGDVKLTGLQPITSTEANENFMRVSSNGKFVAMIQSSAGREQSSIWIKDLVLNKHWQISQQELSYRYLTWNDHQNGIVYSAKNESGINFGVILLDGQNKAVEEKVLFNRHDISWNSPFFIDDEQNLFYLANKDVSEHSRNVTLYRHNISSGELEKLITPTAEFKPYKIALSPGQKHLALVGFNKESMSEIKQLKFSDKSILHIAEIDRNWHFLTWLPDGNSLVLSNGSQLKQVHFNGDITTLNYQSYNFLLYPQISHDGKKLYFIERQVDSDISITHRDELSKQTKFVNSNAADWAGSLSPNEKHLAYISSKAGYPQLFVKGIESNTERLVFSNESKQLAIAPPVWNSNSDQLVSALNNKPFLIKLNKGMHETSWLNNTIGVPLAWYRNTQALLIVDKSNPNDMLLKVNLLSEEKTELLPKNRKQFLLNQNDELLMLEKGRVENITVNQVEFEVASDITKLYSGASGIYFTYQLNEQVQLGFYDFENKQTSEIHDLNEFCQKHCGNISAIGKRFIFTHSKNSSADVLSLDIVKE